MIDCCEKREQERDAYVYKRRSRVCTEDYTSYVCTYVQEMRVYIRTRTREQRLKN